MKGRMGLLFLIVLGTAWACDARELANPELNRKSDVCALCEEYTVEALDYLKDNKTQSEIIDALHNTCNQLFSFKQQCIELVDNYVPLFFIELASVQPEELCKTVFLCQSAKLSSQVRENSCGFCKDAVSALLVKLNDPDIKLEIMESLLKACNSMEKKLAKECKRMVFEYGPFVLMNAEKFLKTTGICTALHACPASTAVSQEASIMGEIPLLSDS
uniref:Pulmonary surfactant-associated protein B n=1 Tax=Lotus japonicus TaxID=34305 RepID=I3S9R9_LOTJA|nr:unknown [Lotus japonicus]